MEILEILKNKEIPNSKEYKYYEFKQEIYQTIFKNLYKQTNNLLVNYFTGHVIEKQHETVETMLLLQQSNLSQKHAIKAALKDSISVIEGPPGTGKTTTIINIIANLVYQNKKVVIVSKNNSAIDNVVEELDKMNLPEFYIRFGNSEVMKNLIKEIPDKIFKLNKELNEIQEIDINEEVIKLKQLIYKINSKVHFNYNYIEENFLSTILKSMKIDSTLLMEHYRCDYNIINFCNKYFYDNKLIIYTDANKNAISLIDSDKGKYVQREGSSFYNEREIKTISTEIDDNIDKKFIITPFKGQSEKLVKQYNKNQCGTIHTFQGRGEDSVFFSTVLNKTPESIFHVQGKNNLFTKELINVAVSRAKKKFVLVTDTAFF